MTFYCTDPNCPFQRTARIAGRAAATLLGTGSAGATTLMAYELAVQNPAMTIASAAAATLLGTCTAAVVKWLRKGRNSS
ncbi:hypothetical protein OG588_34070 [Streptomyces prunicolor]|uniref:hypothetical protein n=1 Tax=Streptomyces prunicolor TaxID=67348 RepID=UPI00386CB6F1|nr:hypothetical protein OG588_34070 [Streptomyces prunicolor]